MISLPSIKIAGMNPVAEAGFPDKICPVIFLRGCNLRCPYCLNGSIVEDGRKDASPSVKLDDVVTYLMDNGEKDILVSGGEPCMHEENLTSLAEFLHSLGIRVRLSTNGTYPTVLGRLMHRGLLSFVAIDVKTNVFGGSGLSALTGHAESNGITQSLSHNIIQSLSDIASNAKRGDAFSYEVRTTLYPPVIGEGEVAEIAKHLPHDAVWVLQQFRAKKGLLGGRRRCRQAAFQRDP